VADVHILGQDMVNAVSEREQKLPGVHRQPAGRGVFRRVDAGSRPPLPVASPDPRLPAERKGPTALGDIQAHLLGLFKSDPDLAQALCPQVFAGQVQEAFGKSLQEALQYYVRIALMREWGRRSSNGTAWRPGGGRMAYAGVSPEDPAIQAWAAQYRLTPRSSAEGIARS